MINFLFANYVGLDKSHVVKVMLKTKEILLGRIYSAFDVESFPLLALPDAVASMHVIKDIAAYIKDRNNPDNIIERRLYKNEVESIQIYRLVELIEKYLGEKNSDISTAV
jgi:hypothetical protein